MIIKKKAVQKTEEQIKAEAEAAAAQAAAEEQAKIEAEKKKKEEEINLFDIDNIDFTQRKERRTGNRRRGYRRIDDRNLVSRAQEEAAQIKQNAYQEGYSIGIQQAAQDLAAFYNVLGNFMNAEERVFSEVAPKILEIAMEIAQKVIKTEIKTDPQIVLNTIMDILKTLSKNEPKIVIKINPVQIQYIKDTLPEKINLLGMETNLSVYPDENIMEGGCIVQTNNGLVDASIEAQLDIVQAAIRSIV